MKRLLLLIFIAINLTSCATTNPCWLAKEDGSVEPQFVADPTCTSRGYEAHRPYVFLGIKNDKRM